MLFSEKKKYLHIVLNDKPFTGTLEELFNPQKFEKFCLITYVSSPSFFFQKVKPFKKVVAILGEEDVAGEFYALNPFVEEKFLKELGGDKELLEKILKTYIEIILLVLFLVLL